MGSPQLRSRRAVCANSCHGLWLPLHQGGLAPPLRPVGLHGELLQSWSQAGCESRDETARARQAKQGSWLLDERLGALFSNHWLVPVHGRRL